MDFIVGVQVCLSNNHTVLLQPGETTSDKTQLRADGTPKANAVRHLVDICDELQGRYPKGFKFTGWHPHCRCHVITILKTEEEMKQDTQRILRGEEPTPDSVNSVDELPPNFTEWVKKRKGKITNATNPPYFIKDNRAAVNGILGIGGSAEVTPKKQLSLLEIAEQRHAKRTQEQVDDIIRRARERDINNLAAYLQRYGEFTEYPDDNDTHFQSYRGMEKAFERLTPEQRLEVLRRGKFSGMLNPENFFGYDVPDIYTLSTKQRMIDRVKEELDNKFIGNDVEDTNHYIVCLKSGKIIDTTELEKRLSAKQYEDALWISANEGLSNYQYWYKDEKARNKMIEYMGFDEWKDGRVIVRSKWSPWKDTDDELHQLSETLEKPLNKVRKMLERQDREKMVILNRKGIVIGEFMGDARSVNVTEEAEKLIKDNWITHNHPTGKDQTGIRRFGYSLSQDDVVETIRCNARGIVAESPTYRYMIERPVNGWNLNSDDVGSRYNELYKELKRKYQNSINYHPDVAILLQHLVMKQLSKEFGFTYLYIKKS